VRAHGDNGGDDDQQPQPDLGRTELEPADAQVDAFDADERHEHQHHRRDHGHRHVVAQVAVLKPPGQGQRAALDQVDDGAVAGLGPQAPANVERREGGAQPRVRVPQHGSQQQRQQAEREHQRQAVPQQ
jgi:hypothetical protein